MIWMVFIEEYSPNIKWKILILFDDMIANILSNKALNPIVNELFIRGRNLTQSYFVIPGHTIKDSTNCIYFRYWLSRLYESL